MTTGFEQIKYTPTMTQILNQIKLSVMSNLNCHNIGRVTEFDKNTQTCTVELMQIKTYNNMSFMPPPITQVPLIIYGAQNGHITLPNPVGTYCLLFFLDRNIDNFIITGEQYTPDTTRMHDFTDCVAITTFKTLANPLSDYDERAVSIFNKETIEAIIYDSYIKVYGNSIELDSTDGEKSSHLSITAESITNTTTNQAVTAESVNITADNKTETVAEEINITANNYELAVGESAKIQSEAGGSVEVGATVKISNSAQDLNLLIQAFLTACEGITISGTKLNPASKQAFTTLKSQFEELLQ